MLSVHAPRNSKLCSIGRSTGSVGPIARILRAGRFSRIPRVGTTGATSDPAAQAAGKRWVAVSWLFLVEPIDEHRCRFISRYRADSSTDLGTRVAFGPAVLEPVGYAMDRRMLLGVKERAERVSA